jgi:hypothetical protein
MPDPYPGNIQLNYQSNERRRVAVDQTISDARHLIRDTPAFFFATPSRGNLNLYLGPKLRLSESCFNSLIRQWKHGRGRGSDRDPVSASIITNLQRLKRIFVGVPLRRTFTPEAEARMTRPFNAIELLAAAAKSVGEASGKRKALRHRRAPPALSS